MERRPRAARRSQKIFVRNLRMVWWKKPLRGGKEHGGGKVTPYVRSSISLDGRKKKGEVSGFVVLNYTQIIPKKKGEEMIEPRLTPRCVRREENDRKAGDLLSLVLGGGREKAWRKLNRKVMEESSGLPVLWDTRRKKLGLSVAIHRLKKEGRGGKGPKRGCARAGCLMGDQGPVQEE